MERKHVYVAVPLTQKRDKKQAQLICEYLSKKGIRVTSPWVTEENAKQGLSKREVCERDIFAVAISDAVVAEVSKPSLGIGMELMVALCTDTPIVCLYEEESDVSWMVLGAPAVHLVPYPPGCIYEALGNLAPWLKSLPLMSVPKKIFLKTNSEVRE